MTKNALTITVLTLCLAVLPGVTGLADGSGWVPLFDGKTLDGWKVNGGTATYKVEDGVIVGTTVDGSPNTFLCKGDYKDFILELDVKCDPRLNSGVQVRSHVYEKDDANPANRKRAGVVYGPQCEIASKETGTAGRFYDEGRRGKWLAEIRPEARDIFRDDDWNRYRIIVQGNRYRSWVNGIAASDFTDDVENGGFIGLQVHGIAKDQGPYQVRWRGIRIKELKPGEEVSSADPPEGFKAVFTGHDLNGWEGSPKYWSVEDGCLTGKADGTLKFNRFLTWRGGTVRNFELRVKVKVSPTGNSGLQYRGTERPDLGESVVTGYQCDVVANRPDYNGMLYEERGRRILAHTGEMVVIDPIGQPWVVGQFPLKAFIEIPIGPGVIPDGVAVNRERENLEPQIGDGGAEEFPKRPSSADPGRPGCRPHDVPSTCGRDALERGTCRYFLGQGGVRVAAIFTLIVRAPPIPPNSPATSSNRHVADASETLRSGRSLPNFLRASSRAS
jgi:hypothetical protein